MTNYCNLVFLNFLYLSALLLSAHVERLSVSCLHDFLIQVNNKPFINSIIGSKFLAMLGGGLTNEWF